MTNKTIYSVHHFMFAFRWDYIKRGKLINEISLNDRTSFKNIDKMFPIGKWERKSSLSIKDFNHYTYFHPFVRDTLYDYKNHDSSDIVRYYEYNLSLYNNPSYIIKYFEKKESVSKPSRNKSDYDEKQYFLEISGITLHFFKTGVGVLSFDLQNPLYSQSNPSDILKINEMGRRIYPQFLNFDIENEPDILFNSQRVFLSKSIEVLEVEEDFEFYKTLKNIKHPINLPKFIKNLFGNSIVEENTRQSSDKMRIKHVTDDRMFFLSWYGNDCLSKEIASNYPNSDWWYAYIFGDKTPKSIANNNMQERQLCMHTYDRWCEYGTIYGVSRDSFVCLSATTEFFKEYDLPNLREHQSTIYYQIAILCLTIRASVLKFSAEVAKSASLTLEPKSKGKLKKDIQSLYAHYIEFRNKVYFREVTSQIQGIEVYQKFLEMMNIKTEVEDLDNEIDELNRFASMIEQDEQTRMATRLSKLAAIFLPPTLIAGVLGMNTYSDLKDVPGFLFTRYPIWAFWIPVIVIFVIMYFSLKLFNKR